MTLALGRSRMLKHLLRGTLTWGFVLLALIFAPVDSRAETAPKTDPRLAGLSSLVAMEQRIAPIVQRLSVGNAKWCPVTMAMPGWLLGDRRLYRDAIWPLARQVYGTGDDDTPFIAALDPQGPAARAGLRVGDAIVAINGVPLQAPAADPHARMALAHQQLAAAAADKPLLLSIARDNSAISLVPERGCASEFRVEASDTMHAKADGTVVLISGGIVRFADADDELAALIAHELAHNVLRHRARLDAAAIKRGMAQFFGRNARLTKMTEEEADRLAVWLLAGAGYDPSAAARFWTNFGKRHGTGIFQSPTHPGWRKRVASAIAEKEAMERARRSDPAAVPPLIANPGPLD